MEMKNNERYANAARKVIEAIQRIERERQLVGLRKTPTDQMDAAEHLDVVNGDDTREECPYCRRVLSVSHQSVCDRRGLE
jgi:hypothetical protein